MACVTVKRYKNQRIIKMTNISTKCSLQHNSNLCNEAKNNRNNSSNQQPNGKAELSTCTSRNDLMASHYRLVQLIIYLSTTCTYLN